MKYFPSSLLKLFYYIMLMAILVTYQRLHGICVCVCVCVCARIITKILAFSIWLMYCLLGFFAKLLFFPLLTLFFEIEPQSQAQS